MLAVKVILEQGIHVEALNFYTGFCHSGHTSAIRNKKTEKPLRNDALWAAEQLGIKLHIEDIVEPYKQVLINPKYGYGKNINPCLDCKIFMVSQAHQWMEAHGFDFIITGEVIGQRPKSQVKRYLPVIAEQSGAEDRLLRPLCAKLLPPTLPEREGWVDRDKLYDFHGRQRSPQFALAKHYGFTDYAQPAGGCCVLTDLNYTRRLKDFWDHKQDKNYELDDIILLKAGRHIRPKPHFKLIIARDESEHNFLTGYRKQFIHLELLDHRGPIVLIEGNPEEQDLQLSGRIAARFSSGKNEESVRFNLNFPNGTTQAIKVLPFKPEEIPEDWYK